MSEPIVHSSAPLTLVGGAPVSQNLLSSARRIAPRAVAADGGASHLLNMGWMPEKVIGDLDSLTAEDSARLPSGAIHKVDEQDNTDFEKCLLRIAAPLILAVGFRGGRLDHDLAALHGLVRFAAQRCLLLSQDDLVFLCPPVMQLALPEGTPLSLFPMGPVTGRTVGLEYSFERLDYAPGGRIGTSNTVAGLVEIEMSAAVMLCIVPQSHLERVVTQLAAQPDARWPARA